MPRLEQKQSLKQTLSPRQILQAKLLNLNSLSLESYILNEIESNPVLESVESENEGEDEVFEAEDDSLDVLPIDDEYAIIQPKGSINDKNIIKLANKNKITLFFSKYRFFRH